MRVAVLDDYHDAYAGTSGIARLRDLAEVQIFTQALRSPTVLRGFDAVIANRERTRFTRELFEQLPDLRIIAQTGNHIYHIDLDAAEEHGVVVAKATGGGCTSAAELAIGLMISVMRQIPDSDQQIKAGRWPSLMTPVLRGKTLGIIGLGYVGRHVAKLAHAFEMRVVAWGPNLTGVAATAAGAEQLALDALLREADVVSIHATLSDQSRGLIDDRRLRLMKPSAYLINTARGPIVDERALCDALVSGRIAGAGLDVFDVEPLPATHAFRSMSNVVLTPHLGWPTDEMYSRFAEAAADVLEAYAQGKELSLFTTAATDEQAPSS